MSERAWKAYSLATGLAADISGLAGAAALSDDVRGTLRGIVIAAFVMELPFLAWDRAFTSAISRMNHADEELQDVYALLALGLIVAALAWIVVGLLFADLATSEFDISGFWPYVGTLLFVIAAGLTIYLPLYLGRKMKREA